MPPKIIGEPVGDVLVISFLTSTIQNETDVKEAAAALDHYVLCATQKNIVLDLAKVKFMTSSMIGELVKLKKKCDQVKIKLKLCGLSSEVAEVFKITRMDKLFKIYKDRKKAMGRAARR